MLVTILKAEYLPREGAITSDVIAFTCIEDADIQLTGLLFSILPETLILVHKR